MKPTIRMINRFLLLASVAIVALFGLPYLPMSAANIYIAPVPKPQSPVQIKISASDDAQLNQAATFVIQLSSGMDIERLKLNIQLPVSAKLSDGVLYWSGSLLRGENKTLTLVATLTESIEQSIVAAVDVLDAQQNVIYRVGDQYQWLPPSQASSKRRVLSVSATPKRSLRNGNPIIEYPSE